MQSHHKQIIVHNNYALSLHPLLNIIIYKYYLYTLCLAIYISNWLLFLYMLMSLICNGLSFNFVK